jgi:uncharacterized protein
MRSLFLLIPCILLAACGSGQARTDYQAALRLLAGAPGVERNVAQGMALLQKAADGGNADAQLTLGYFYAKGESGLTPDPVKAAEYYLRAAKTGNVDAQYNIGLAYVRAEGVAQDYEEALTWFTKAARQNDAGAQYNLGVMHLGGEGTVKDPLTAYAWFQLARENGYDGAEEGLQDARSQMTAEQYAEIQTTVDAVRQTVRVPPVVKTNTQNMPL